MSKNIRKNFFILSVIIYSFFLQNLCANEKIYAIMITGKDQFHYALALCSIQSFLEQTYPNKKLIIINDGDYNFHHLQNELIEEIHLEKKNTTTLGELRNYGLDAIPENAVWVQWDDDDWHHPNVIQEQYNFMKENDLDVCCMTSQIKYSFQINYASIGRKSCIPGTIMCRKVPKIRYPKMKKGEDSIFLKIYRHKQYKIDGWRNPSSYYIRFIHSHNTWDEEYFNLKPENKDTWHLNEEEKNYLNAVLPHYRFQ